MNKWKLWEGDSSDRETITVLWTGGWDSTYRVIELSRQNVNIQLYIFYTTIERAKNWNKRQSKQSLRCGKHAVKQRQTFFHSILLRSAIFLRIKR